MIYGAAGLTGLTGWRLLQRTASAQTQLLAKDPTVQREQAAFAQRMADDPTADSLVKDYRSLKVALTAFGLEADLPNKAFIRKVLDSDLTDKKSLANRLSDKRYAALAQAFQLGAAGSGIDDSIVTKVTEMYLDREFERRVGESDDSMRLAMNARRELSTLATSTSNEETKWYSILGNPPLATVVRGALGMPDKLSAAPVDTQVATMSAAAKRRFGISQIGDLTDTTKLGRLIDSYVARASLTATSATPYSAALTILQSGLR